MPTPFDAAPPASASRIAGASPATERRRRPEPTTNEADTSAIDLQSVITVLKQAFELYRRNWKPFLITAAVLYVPAVLVTSIMFAALMPAPPTINNLADAMQLMSSASVWGTRVLTYLASFLTTLILTGLATPLINAALTVAVADRMIDGNAGPAQAWKVVLARVPRLLSAIIPAALIIAVGMLLFVLPGLVAAFLLIFTAQVALVEGVGGVEALKRSYKLVLSDWLRVLVLVIVFGFISWFAQMLAGAIAPRFAFFWSSLISGLLTLAILPFTAAGATIIYFERRKATDGLDDDALRREIEAAVR